jgi:hypothetical protein
MAKVRQDFDKVAWDKNGEAAEEIQERLQLKTTCRLVESLVEEVFKKPATLHPPNILRLVQCHLSCAIRRTCLQRDR